MYMSLQKNKQNRRSASATFCFSIALFIMVIAPIRIAEAQVPANAEFHDSHFHLTNYIQQGISI